MKVFVITKNPIFALFSVLLVISQMPASCSFALGLDLSVVSCRMESWCWVRLTGTRRSTSPPCCTSPSKPPGSSMVLWEQHVFIFLVSFLLSSYLTESWTETSWQASHQPVAVCLCFCKGCTTVYKGLWTEVAKCVTSVGERGTPPCGFLPVTSTDTRDWVHNCVCDECFLHVGVWNEDSVDLWRIRFSWSF